MPIWECLVAVIWKENSLCVRKCGMRKTKPTSIAFGFKCCVLFDPLNAKKSKSYSFEKFYMIFKTKYIKKIYFFIFKYTIKNIKKNQSYSILFIVFNYKKLNN